MPHRLDPPIQTEAARTFGKLIAQGIVAFDDVHPDLYRAAIRAGYEGDRRGLRARLSWHLRESADHWRIQRSLAVRVISGELVPMLDALAEGIEILRAGHAINERLGEPLLRSEVIALVETQMADRMAALSPQQKGRRRHVR